MADRFTVTASPSLETPIGALARGARAFADLTTFWPLLAQQIATESSARWPLKRRSGQLRQSLTWAGGRGGLGRGGIYEPTRDALTIGTTVFYGAFSQFGTRRQPARKLVSVDEKDVAKHLATWARERASDAGLTVR